MFIFNKRIIRQTVILISICFTALSSIAAIVPDVAKNEFTPVFVGELLQWNTVGNLGTETTEPSVMNDANLSSSSLTLGPGVTVAANGNRLGGSNWSDTGDTNPTTLAESVVGNDYIQFIVTPNAGFSFTPTSFDYIWDRSGTGPSSGTLRSSADSFTANLGTVTGMVSGNTTVTYSIPISGLTALSTPTTFRLYGYGSTATGGTGGFDTANASTTPNVVLYGTTALIGPSAANGSISGRVVTADGRGISNAVLVVSGNGLGTPRTVRTSSFGYYQIDELETGDTYVVTINSKRFTFQSPSRVISLNDSITDADFIADPQ